LTQQATPRNDEIRMQAMISLLSFAVVNALTVHFCFNNKEILW